MFDVSISHIDTCLSCYLTDHHNRAGELLIGVPVSAGTTRGDVFARLAAEWDRSDYNEDMDADVAEEIETEFQRAFSAMLNETPERLCLPFDPSLEPDDGSEDGEGPQAWFLVTYAEKDEEDDEDAAIAAERIAKLAADPSRPVSGAELIARLDKWVGGDERDDPGRYYFGFVDPKGLRVVTVQPKDKFFGPDLPVRLDLRNHSPSGFGWGYEGSGPAQLALAILCDAVGPTRALRFYQHFKRAVVSHWDQQGSWSITRADVLALAERWERAEATSGEGA